MRHSLLHFRAREAIKQRAVLLLGFKQLAQEDADHLPVPDHGAAHLDRARLRCLKELGNHDRQGGDHDNVSGSGLLDFRSHIDITDFEVEAVLECVLRGMKVFRSSHT